MATVYDVALARISASTANPQLASRSSALRLLGEAHANGIEAAVDVDDLAGNAGGEIGAQEGSGIAHVLEGHIAAQRGDLGDPAQHLAKSRDAGGRQRLYRPRRDAVDADALWPQVRRQKPHIRLEARFGEAHHVVARD